MTTTRARRTGVLALITVAATTLTGCAGVLGATMTYNDTEKAKITDIVLSGGSGDVRITTAPVDATTIKRIIRGTTNPDGSYHLSGSTMNLDGSCGINCSVSYEIQTPPGVNVHGNLNSGDLVLTGVATADVRVSSGDVLISDATGPVKAGATSGDIQVLRAHGTVNATATSGDIRTVDPGGPVTVRATSGDVDVHLSVPTSVTAEATSGDISISVPQGAYKVVTRDHTDDTTVTGITNDPTAKNVLDVKAASGDINIDATA
jgi:hypothetical protein